MPSIRFHRSFFLFTIVLFAVEVCIALFVRDQFVRPFVGDVLVVILLHCAVRTFLNFDPWKVATGVLLFAFAVEYSQYLNLVERLGLGNNAVAKVVLGTTFQWGDLVAYTVGAVIAVVLDRWAQRSAT
jgi:phosphotransferase system  glucose/maltose/N-acetylglucosamine-specific IIC component